METVSTMSDAEIAQCGTLYKTGLMRLKGHSTDFSVSPDGSRFLFNTGRVADGLNILDVDTGKQMCLPAPEGEVWTDANWSHDGKQAVAVVTERRGGRLQWGNRKIILLNPDDWSYRTLAVTPGVIWLPFFSADGKTVYYFKGEEVKIVRLGVSRFDLYSYNLETHEEKRLTNEKMHQISRAYDNGKKILFSAKSSNTLNPISEGGRWQFAVYVFDKGKSELSLMNIDQSDGFFWLYFGGEDEAGNIFFAASRKNPRGGNYLWAIYRCNAQGHSCKKLRDISIHSELWFASQTKELFIDGTVNDEIFFCSIESVK